MCKVILLIPSLASLTMVALCSEGLFCIARARNLRTCMVTVGIAVVCNLHGLGLLFLVARRMDLNIHYARATIPTKNNPWVKINFT